VQTTQPPLGETTPQSSTYDVGYMYAPDAIEWNFRSVVIGSTAAQIEAALLECKQFSQDCQKSWYEDELERTVILTPFSLDKFEVTVSQFAQYVEQSGYITDAEKRGMSYGVDKPYDDYAVVKTDDLNWRNTYAGI